MSRVTCCVCGNTILKPKTKKDPTCSTCPAPRVKREKVLTK